MVDNFDIHGRVTLLNNGKKLSKVHNEVKTVNVGLPTDKVHD